MNFETDLVARLEAAPAVTAIVGDRIYWSLRPQKTPVPALVLNMVAGFRAQHFGGVMGTQGNQIQFDCMAPTQSVAVALRDAVIAVIEAPGEVGDTEFQGGNVDLHRGIAEDTAGGVVRTEQVRATIWFN